MSFSPSSNVSRNAFFRHAAPGVISALLLFLLTHVPIASAQTARLDTAFVKRGADGVLVARWRTTPAGAPVAIYAGTDPETISRKRPVAQASDTSQVRLPAHSDSTTRHYFRLVPEGSNEGYIVAERHLPLEGASNFRDLGGYRAEAGKRLRWGTVYRSGNIADLTEQDLTLFSNLGIELVCDLRTPPERERYPDRYPEDPAPETLHLDISGSTESNLAANISTLFERISAGETTLAEAMGKGYRDMIINAAPLYARMFEQMLKPEHRPFLFHCQGGQDRAGIGAALLLMALDVPRETIVQDYLLTNRYRAELDERALKHYAEEFDISMEVMRGVAQQDITAETILNIFDAMETEYGSTDRYLREALGLTKAKREHLKAALLQ